MPHDPPTWYDEKADNPPWIRALAEVRRRATLEGYRYHHVQASLSRSISTPKRPWVTGSIF
jgi:hypothetical protein